MKVDSRLRWSAVMDRERQRTSDHTCLGVLAWREAYLSHSALHDAGYPDNLVIVETLKKPVLYAQLRGDCDKTNVS